MDIIISNGLYFVSLEPITIAPGEDPILLNMTISADRYEDKTFETYIAIDPDTLVKDRKPSEQLPLIIIIIVIISTVMAIGVATATLFLLHKKRQTSEVI
ncbi:MAG: hypothetical protein ACFFDH_00810 [Promethearchaeota archaeon]